MRVEVLTLSKPALMSRSNVDTWNLSLWRVPIAWGRVREPSKKLRAGREPHWYGWRRPLERAMGDNLTAMTFASISSRLF